MAGRLFHIYCDESSIESNHQFMVIGGIMLPADLSASLATSVQAWRERVNMTRELKWTRVSDGRYAQYLEFVNGIFHYIHRRKMSFRCMILDRRKIDYRAFHDGDSERGFYRFMSYLVFHTFMQALYNGDRVIVFPDHRCSRGASLTSLKYSLNNKASNKLGWAPVANVQAIDSASSCIMQMTDVLMGAVAHQANRRDQVPGCRIAKVNLARHIACRAGIKTLDCTTPRRMQHFGIWQFRLQERKNRPAS